MTIMVIMYSGYLAGFFPTEERISWESHLFGAIAGLWTAFIFRNFREHDEVAVVYEWQDKTEIRRITFLSAMSLTKHCQNEKQNQNHKIVFLRPTELILLLEINSVNHPTNNFKLFTVQWPNPLRFHLPDPI